MLCDECKRSIHWNIHFRTEISSAEGFAPVVAVIGSAGSNDLVKLGKGIKTCVLVVENQSLGGCLQNLFERWSITRYTGESKIRDTCMKKETTTGIANIEVFIIIDCNSLLALVGRGGTRQVPSFACMA